MATVAKSDGSSSITVTRSATIWRNSYRDKCLIMAIPVDVSELTGLRAGDKLLVTGSADGTVRVVKADKIG